jgi:uncharacterized lipoprotein YmbA
MQQWRAPAHRKPVPAHRAQRLLPVAEVVVVDMLAAKHMVAAKSTNH